jgi:myosin heavy subunit
MANIWKWLAIVALILLVAVGAGLGAAFAHKSSEFSATSANLTITKANLASTELDLASTQNDLKDTQNALASTQSQLKTTSDNLTATKNQLDTTQSQLTTTQSQLTTAQSQLTTTQNDLNSKSQQLTDIQKVYPLKPFPDLNTLKTWLSTQPIIPFTFQNTSSLQDAAAKDGWIISAGIDWSATLQMYATSNTAILANGDVYMFFCNDHTLHYELNIYH